MGHKIFLLFLYPLLFFYFFVEAATEIITLPEIKPGDILTARTRIDNDEMHHFPVKVLSIIRSGFSRYPIIIAESDDPFISKTRIASGMSGSPVYAEERLAGAIAYSWSFLEKPVMGITPIEEMLPIIDYQGKEPSDVYGVTKHGNGRAGDSGFLEMGSWYDPYIIKESMSEYHDFLKANSQRYPFLSQKIEKLKSWMNFQFKKRSQAPKERNLSEPSFPITVSWNGPRGKTSSDWDFWGQVQEQLFPGMAQPVLTPIPVQSISPVSVNESKEIDVPLIPGDYIGINLVRGEVELNIFGTVTYVEGDTLLAFGHSMGGRGAIRLPLYRARTEIVMPLQNISFKMGRLVQEIGTVEQDRQSGVVGRLGLRANYFPVEMVLDTPLRKETYRFEVVNSKQFSTPLLGFSLSQLFAQVEGLGQPVSFDYSIHVDYSTSPNPETSETGDIQKPSRDMTAMDNRIRTINLSNRVTTFNSREGVFQVANEMMNLMQMIQDNPFEPGIVQSIKVQIISRPEYQFLRAVTVRTDRQVYRPGEEIHLEVGFERYQKLRVYQQFTYRLPEQIPDGDYHLAISSAQMRWLTEVLMANPYSLKSLESISDFLSSRPPTSRLSVWELGNQESILIKDNLYRRLPTIQRKLLMGAFHNEKSSAAEIRFRDYDLGESVDGFLTFPYRVDSRVELNY